MRVSSVLLAVVTAVAAGLSFVAIGVPAVAPSVVQSGIASDGFPPSLPSKAHPAVLFIGDSYTQGPSTPDLSYGCISATELGWECNIAAQPGTGYLSGGPGHRLERGEYDRPSTSFVERLPRLRELYRADIVILDGGRSDMQYDMNDVMPTFAYTVNQVIETWPNSRIVVIAPWFLKEPALRPGAFTGRTVGEAVWSALRASPAFDKVDLIDPAALGWFVDTDVTNLTDDGIHPNSNGAKMIAGLLTTALLSGGVPALS
jgi:GDSL-like Lipase/Acylhydrolase family